MICPKKLLIIIVILVIGIIIWNCTDESFGVYPRRYGYRYGPYRYRHGYGPYRYRYRYRYNPWYWYDYLSPVSWYYYWKQPYDYSQVQPMLSQ